MSCSPEVLCWLEKCYAEEGKEEAGEEEGGKEGPLSQTIPEPAQALNEALGSESAKGTTIKGLVNRRRSRDSGVTEYKVRWDGCGDTEDSWVDAASIPELHKRKYSVSIEKRKRHRSWDSFKRDIKDRSTKTTFGKTHRRGPRFLAPDIRYGYKISCATPLPLKRGPWSTAILCDYDPKRFKGCIGFEVYRGYGDYSYHSYHTMEMHKFKKLISGNQITIKKI